MNLIQMYQRAISHYGEDKQIEKCREELHELNMELLNYIIKPHNKDLIISEMADVMNMISQVQLILGIDSRELYEEMERKMNRTIKRIEMEGK